MLGLQKTSKTSKRPRTELTKEERDLLLRQCAKDPVSAGRTLYLHFLNGENLTYKEQIIAKCFDCDGGHSDGRYDCEMPSCSLYPSMPYKGTYSPHSLQSNTTAR